MKNLFLKLVSPFLPRAELATYLENELYDHLFRNAAFTSPATVYAALFSTSASLANLEAGTLTGEISGNGYARTAITFGPPTDGLGDNSGAVTFPAASGGNWGTIRYMAIMDAATAGNVLAYTQLDADVVINNGNQFQFNAANIAVDFKPSGSELSNQTADDLYNHVLRNLTYASPANVYLALFTSAATVAELEGNDFTNEVANANGYARLALTVTAPTDGAGSNSGDHTFAAAAGGNWGTIRYVAIVDNSTHASGQILGFSQLDADVVINDGNTFQFNSGDLDIQLQ